MGHISWVVVYRHSGRLRWYTLSGNLGLADARKEASKVLRDAALGKDPASSVKAARLADTFGELAEQYMDRHAKVHKRSWREDRRALDRDILPRFKNLKAKDVRRADILALIDTIVERGAPVLANRTLEMVRRIFNWGIEKEIVEANPCVAIKPVPESSRDRILSEAEIRGLWAALDAAPTHAGARFKLQLLTAQRPGEVRQMRWVDVDDDGGWWTILAGLSKNKLAHRVPLTAAALQILDRLKEITGSGDGCFRARQAARCAATRSHGARSGNPRRSMPPRTICVGPSPAKWPEWALAAW
jgi:integrase